ncbi:hypothetical protein JVX90_08845 [Gordonia sp. PDNC005]|uniref:hypothetical protein n=1 Tax=unclassified Gordonia (in: high G+C Gram-positive bacteria) TaxID=2657482 RepID=UPI001965A5B7|nr:hypothetical protein [Gordonia sp. PDNC005]QRY64261.1 hypothetical protein JVX90_08845 [Gordonia sp. PDNC005]
MDSREPTPYISLPADGRRGVDQHSVALIVEPTSWPAILGALAELDASTASDERLLLTLDNLAQCLYTSGHARNRHDLDGDVEYPDDDSPAALYAYETHIIRTALHALHDPERAEPWESLAAASTDTAVVDALAVLNREPERLLERTHVVQRAAVPTSADLVASIPNGYFEGDWSPFASHTVARRMNDKHGYALIGVGASTLAFRRMTSASTDPSVLIADVQHLYGAADSRAWDEVRDAVTDSPILVLGYAEDFVELAD